MCLHVEMAQFKDLQYKGGIKNDSLETGLNKESEFTNTGKTA